MNTALLIATQNRGKLGEFRNCLGQVFSCELASEAIDVVEDGKTYYENALKKALRYYERYRRPVLADDSGLEVDALEGRPGVHSARFGGENLDWPARWAYLYAALTAQSRPLPYSAAFVCVLCFYDGLLPPQFFEGKASGAIAESPRGVSGFGYDPVFYSHLLGKTFGEASQEEKERVSHRGEALRRFVTWWKSTHPAA